jgi:hypothetical protein
MKANETAKVGRNLSVVERIQEDLKRTALLYFEIVLGQPY